MSERYYITGVQLGILLASLEHGDLKTVIKTLNDITKNQFVGNINEPSKEVLAIVSKMRMEPDVGSIGKYKRRSSHQVAEVV